MRLLAFVFACFIEYLIFTSVHAQASFFIESGASIHLKEQSGLTLVDLSFVNDGEFIAESGTVSFLQDSFFHPLQIKGSRSTTFDNLTLNLSHGTLEMQKNIQVNGILHLQGGQLDLFGNRLTLGRDEGQINGENPQHYIKGEGEIWKSQVIHPGLNSHGNIGLTIHSDHLHPEINIIRKHKVHQSTAGPTIQRLYKIQGGNTSLKSSLFRFYFLPHETSNLLASQLNVWQKKGEEWISRIPSLVNDSASFVEFSLNGLGSMKLITLGLPLQARQAGMLSNTTTNIKLFPNPTEGSFLIVFEEALATPSPFLLRNINGQLVDQGVIPMGVTQHKLSLERQAAGWYMVSVIRPQMPLSQIPVLKSPGHLTAGYSQSPR